MFGVRGTGDTSGYGGLTRTIELPGGATPPFGGWWDEAYARIGELVPNYSDVITKVVVHRGEITFHVAREHLIELVQHLRDDAYLRYEFCSSVSGVHYPADSGRELHAVYHLQSMTHNRRIRLEVSAPDSDPHIPSVVRIYPTADWHERETYDMFGIVFDGHPALTRILMPDDWPGHPQRKDYPLGGIPVEYKGATIAPPDQRRSYLMTFAGGRPPEPPHKQRRGPLRRLRRRRGRGSGLHRHRPGLGLDRLRAGRARRRADRGQHGAAAPLHPRRAPADPGDGGGVGARGPLRHRVPAHRHREEHGVPHLDPGHHVLHPDGLPVPAATTRPPTASASSGCWASRRRSPRRPASSG